MTRLFSAYTKKELIALIEKTMNDSDIAILTTALQQMDSKPKLKLTNLTFQFPHEMLAKPENVLHALDGNITTSLIFLKKPKEQLSKQYLNGVKNNGGVFGFTIEQK